jgi:SAM-dependent methyltransferase
MIYHIADPAAQGRALSEMVRVLRPGGALVLHAANPRPLLFPLRMLFRMVAETPGLADLARRIKGPSLVPYNPQRIAWTLRRISTAGPIIVIGGGIASTAFNRNVTEFRAHGKFAWRAFEMIEERWPRSAANLGNYVVYMVRKST